MTKRWVPLEANPDVMTRFAHRLGLDSRKASFCDVFGLDKDCLSFVPRPVYALILLFPITPELDEAAKKVDAQKREAAEELDKSIFYMKQTISNACGTIGVLHVIGNNQSISNLRDDSFFQHFFRDTEGLSPAQKGKYLEDPPDGAPSIEEAHQEAAIEGDTAPILDEDVTPHFIALINHNGRLVELDGRKEFPVDHGPTSQETLLEDAAAVAQTFMNTSESINFNLIAFTAST